MDQAGIYCFGPAIKGGIEARVLEQASLQSRQSRVAGGKQDRGRCQRQTSCGRPQANQLPSELAQRFGLSLDEGLAERQNLTPVDEDGLLHAIFAQLKR